MNQGMRRQFNIGPMEADPHKTSPDDSDSPLTDGGLRSRLWVGAQFGVLAAMLAWPARWRIDMPALVLGAAALAAAAWVLAYNRPGNFNIRPDPRAGGRLITQGPYRFVRHPMYVSLLLGAGAVALASHAAAQGLLWVVLLLVLEGKAAMEERLLAQRWPEYAVYRARTGRFMPRAGRPR